jgi:hypothetical protein
MGYQQRGSHRESGRGRGIPRHEKARTKKRKHHPRDILTPERSQAPTPEETANRTSNTLNHLANQRFVLSPFSEELNLWLANLKSTLSEFESNPGITIDDLFAQKRSQIISNIEVEFEKRRYKEAHSGETVKKLSENKTLLEQIKQDCARETRNIEKREETEAKTLASKIEDIRNELNRITRMKTGILRGISKNAKAQREAEAKQRLEAAQNELAAMAQSFDAEQEKAQTEYEKKKLAVLRQVQEDEKEIQSQEIDDSLEVRHTACEALIDAVNSLLKRQRLDD